MWSEGKEMSFAFKNGEFVLDNLAQNLCKSAPHQEGCKEPRAT